MNGKELFEIWAPSTHEIWTKFAKPALFANMRSNFFTAESLQVPHIPDTIAQFNNKSTAIIVDLPGALGIEMGLGLVEIGFIPVPLYNVANEDKIGFLSNVVDNTPIVAALKAGAAILQNTAILDTALPAFLLDYERSKEIDDNSGMYDNRWSIEFEDMPDASYIKNAGINRIVLWTKDEMRRDLLPILESYQSVGIEVITYTKDSLTLLRSNVTPLADTNVRENVRKYENARFALLLFSGLALVNLFFMFFIHSAPLFWTAPSIMWLTYLWVAEPLGDVLAVGLSIAYLSAYFLSSKRRDLMIAASVFIGLDAAIFYAYTVYYGLEAWLEGLGLILLALPILFLVFLIKGVIAHINLKDIGTDEYDLALDNLDNTNRGGSVRRRHFRGFRGYHGYGGSGFGGYSGGGYSGYGGGYSGGFGG